MNAQEALSISLSKQQPVYNTIIESIEEGIELMANRGEQKYTGIIANPLHRSYLTKLTDHFTNQGFSVLIKDSDCYKKTIIISWE